MRTWGKVNYKQLDKFSKQLKKLDEKDSQQFAEKIAKALAARMLALVIPRTPVGDYEDERIGGTLRRGWTSKSEKEAELGAVFGGTETGAIKYANTLPIKKIGNVYEIQIINPVSYAPYVEFGHRTRNHKGWVDGRFMLTISEQQLEELTPKLVERRLKKFLEEVLKE